MIEEVMLLTEEKMEKAIHAYQRELGTIRTGRASATLLDRVAIDYYGTLTPISQIASISVPEARQLLIKAYDPSSLKDIERAIGEADLGLTPQNDGQVIRINIPPLTEERRREMVKLANKMAEEAKVAIRNIRRDANDQIKKSDATEDLVKSYQDDVQKMTDDFIKNIDQIAKDKEKDVMEV